MQMTAEAHEHTGNQEDHEYDNYLEKINKRVATLIADLREVRATIEAYSKTALIGGKDKASANGIGISRSAKAPPRVHVRATINGQRLEYIIDRWD